MFSDLDSTQKKVLIFAGIGILVLFVIIKMRSGGTSTSTTASTDAGAIANLQSQIDSLQMSSQASGMTNVPSSTQPYDPTVSGGTPSPTTIPQGLSVGTWSSAPVNVPILPQHTVPSNPAPTTAKYAPIHTQGLSVHQLEQTAVAHPGAPVVQSGGGYAIAKAGANGKIQGVATSYNSAVNQAGGQWINHQWYAGSYNNQGRFVTKSSAAQAQYDAAVPNNPR